MQAMDGTEDLLHCEKGGKPGYFRFYVYAEI